MTIYIVEGVLAVKSNATSIGYLVCLWWFHLILDSKFSWPFADELTKRHNQEKKCFYMLLISILSKMKSRYAWKHSTLRNCDMYVWVFKCKCVCLNVELHICFHLCFKSVCMCNEGCWFVRRMTSFYLKFLCFTSVDHNCFYMCSSILL